jgi:DNA repair protein RecO (recombination protein O)
MNTAQSEAIIIRLVNYSDSSKIIHFFTRKYGIRHAMFRGLKRKSSKYGSILNQFNEVEIFFKDKESSEMIYLDDFELINSNFEISESLDRYYYSLLFCELISKTAQANHTDEDLYYCLSNFLKQVKTVKHPEPVLIRSLMNLSSALGFEFNLDYCSNCSERISEKYQFSYSLGILCDDCAKAELPNPLFPEQFKCLYAVQKIDIEKIDKISINKKLFLEILSILLRFIENQIDEKLNFKSMEFIRTL